MNLIETTKKNSKYYTRQEELMQAKDEAMQSWLDSRPLINELEKLQKCLADAKKCCSSTEILYLESQLETIHTNTRSKKEEEVRNKSMIIEINQDSIKAQEKTEQIRLEMEEEYRVRSKQKQVIRLRRQTRRILKPTPRAMRLESEAYGASAAAALQHTCSYAQRDSTTVQLARED